ncbi:mRNA splicing protein, partial [Cladochytrium tenue]
MVCSLPKPQSAASRSKWDDDDDDDAGALTRPSASTAVRQLAASGPPPYGRRKGFVPRSAKDFGDGGAFPEINVAQYPLDMGRKGGKGAGEGTLALQTDADGNLRYDLVLRQGQRDDKVIHSQFKDLVAKDVSNEEDRSRPSEEEVLKVTEKTREALEKLTNTRIKASGPKIVQGGNAKDPQFVRYTPSSSSGGASTTRIIRMVEAPVDPMEPPRFKHQKVPRAPLSPPVPVMHSPPRKVTAEEQANWVIPPCVSNWKNAKGYTIPLHQRLAADGRGIQDVQINDNFAKLGEALAIADRHAREEVRVRAEMQSKLAAKAKREKEEKLRMLAQRAREERSGIAPSAPAGSSGGIDGPAGRRAVSDSGSDESEVDSDDDEKVKERDEMRRERARMRERELRMSHMGADTKARVLSKMADRDISEKIALGLAQPTVSRDSMFDQRLFNQSSGLASGFGSDDAYALYDKPLFTGSSANAIYRPRAGGADGGQDPDGDSGGVPGVRTDRIERIVDGAAGAGARAPHRGFKGAEGGSGGAAPRDGPVLFERETDGGGVGGAAADADDPFGVDRFMSSAAKRAGDAAGGS